VEPGGRAYIDFLALGQDEGILQLTVDVLGEDVYAEVLSFDSYPSECEPPVTFPSGAPPVEAQVLIEQDCRHATLAMVHTDPVRGSIATVSWGVTFNAPVMPTLGDIYLYEVSLDASGAIMASGSTNLNAAILRYKENGSPFLRNPLILVDGAQFGATRLAPVTGSAMDSDGQLFVTGTFVKPNNNSSIYVMALNAAGELDSTFSSDGLVDFGFWGTKNGPTSMILDLNGRIVVAGTTWSGSFSDQIAIARLNQDGSLDSSFSGDGKVTNTLGWSQATDVAVDSQNRVIVVCDYFDFDLNRWEMAVVRYTSGGTLDSTFDSDGIVKMAFYRGLWLAVDGSDRIVIGGDNSRFGTGDPDLVVMRFNTDGSLDTNFATAGVATSDLGGFSADGVIDDAGRIVALADDGRVFRYTSSGSLDSAFGSGGITSGPGVPSPHGMAIAIDEEGRMVTTGFELDGATGSFVARYAPNGTPDPTFGDGGTVVIS